MKDFVLLPITLGICCTPLNAMTQIDDYVYLDCDLSSAVYECNNQETDMCEYSGYHQYREHLRFSESKNDIGDWSEEDNEYSTWCKVFECNVGEEVVQYNKSIDPNGFTSWSMQINRMTGAYSADNRINANLPGGSMYLISGSCSRSTSKIITTKKF